MDPKFRVEIHDRDGRHTIAIVGDVDFFSAAKVDDALSGLCSDGATHVELDLRGVTFMDSVGLRSLLMAMDVCDKAGTDLRIIPNPLLHRVFEVTGLLKILPWTEAAP